MMGLTTQHNSAVVSLGHSPDRGEDMSMERYYTRPRVIKRLREGTLGMHIDGFAACLYERGYKREAAQIRLRLVADLSRWMQRRDLTFRDLDEETVDAFLCSRRRRRCRARRGYDAALRMLLEYLRGDGLTAARARQPADSERHRLLRAFEKHLKQERGLSPGTMDYHLRDTQCFLDDLHSSGPILPSELRAHHIVHFFLSRTHDTSPGSAARVATTLRVFLRFLRQRGAVDSDLAACVPSVRRWRLMTLPKFLPQEHAELLLKHCDRRTAVGRRDFAILLLLARLGLRAGEIVTMALDDIDWETGLVVVHGKGPQTSRLPLPWDVGKALAEYLRKGRPHCSSRRVFIRSRAPLRGFSRSIAIGHIVRRALARAGLHPPCKGAHVLRHTLATQMLRRGASLTEIGQILRHRHPDTTALYAKVDLAKLQAVSQPWLGGIS